MVLSTKFNTTLMIFTLRKYLNVEGIKPLMKRCTLQCSLNIEYSTCYNLSLHRYCTHCAASILSV